MLVRPHASARERELFGRQAEGRSRHCIAQPTLRAVQAASASSYSGISPRHVDTEGRSSSPAPSTADRTRRPHPRRANPRLGGQLEPEQQHQGHLGRRRRRCGERELKRCSRARPTTCSGSPGRWTRRLPRAHDRGDAAPRISAPERGGGPGGGMGGRAQRRRRLRGFNAGHGDRRGERGRLSHFDRSNPYSICDCLENARANRRAVRTALTVETWTAINDAWLELKRFEATRRRQGPRPRGAGALPRIRQESLARLRRLVLPHAAAQRRLLVQPAGDLHRAGRQHGAAARREVPSPAAVEREGRRFARLFPVGGDPARGVGGDRLSLGLSRPGQAVADRRSLDPEPGHAALADLLLREHRSALELWRARTAAAARRSARRARCSARSNARA